MFQDFGMGLWYRHLLIIIIIINTFHFLFQATVQVSRPATKVVYQQACPTGALTPNKIHALPLNKVLMA